MSALLDVIYRPALTTTAPDLALRQVIIRRLIQDRISREELRAELNEMLADAREAGDDEAEDALLTSIAELVGWCRPENSLEHIGWSIDDVLEDGDWALSA